MSDKFSKPVGAKKTILPTGHGLFPKIASKAGHADSSQENPKTSEGILR